ncbi:MAG: hypothetical protein ISR69_01705 [Gammaproteobacteria bacterium]|nr:hypothetical protein [Gammaproteobacteria bacterium]
MKQLRIFFRNKELTDYRWCYFANGSVLEQGGADAHSLSVLAQKANEVVFVLPQQWLLCTTLSVDGKANKQLLAAACYQLEDQLAQDVDLLHFAQGAVKQNQVDYVVIEHQLMQQLVDLQKAQQITANKIIAESSLVKPAEDNEVIIQQHEEHYLIYTQAYNQVSVCHHDQINFYLKQFYSQDELIKVTHLDQSDFDLLLTEKDLSKVINLRQKNYSQSHFLQSSVKKLLLPVTLLCLFAVFYFFNLWQNNQVLLSQYEQLINQQQQILKKYTIKYKSDENAKKLVIKALQKQQSPVTENDFISTFHQFLSIAKIMPSVEIKKLLFKHKSLTLDITANNFQVLDKLSEQLKQTEFKVSLGQMTTIENKSHARLTMEVN